MIRLLPLVLCVSVCVAEAEGVDAADGDWSAYASDKRATKYTELDQIHAGNIGALEVQWRWQSIDHAILDADPTLWPGPNESTPLAIDGTLYTVTSLSQVAAIDGETGRTLWTYDPQSYRNGNPPNIGFINRGVSYWSDGDDCRVIYGTGDGYLIALNAKTGQPIPTFGNKGRIDLTQGLRRPISRALYGVTSPPTICRNRIVIGASISDVVHDQPPPPGDVRAFDVRTGKQAWVFQSIPQDAAASRRSWGNDSWKTVGNTNVWTYMSCDEQLGHVYLPFGTPSNDYYGGERPGDNLYAESIVAVDINTGKAVWHFQGVHHGIWDYDFPCAPIVVDITVAGRPIKALVQVSKQAFTYVLDRETGKPVWPIPERKVPQSPVLPGEHLWPTQPIPTKPAPFDRQGFTAADLIDFTPELKREALKIFQQFDHGPLYTPFNERGTIMQPGIIGGASWAGAAVDPASGTMYVPSVSLPWVLQAVKGSDAGLPQRYLGDYVGESIRSPTGPHDLPINKPPYGRVTAIDLNTGNHKWMRPMGEGPRQHPALRHLNLPKLGWPARTFVIRTPSLLLAVQEGPSAKKKVTPTAFETFRWNRDPALIAMDPRSGDQIAKVALPGNASGAPITYLAGGQQYIAVPIGGSSLRAELVVLRLPRTR